MKKIILYILGCIFSSIGLLISCTSSEEDLYGSFSGIVTDADTKQPLNGVSVSITPQGETKVTGSDGAYTFLELAPTEYTVAYKRDGYEPDTKKVKIEAGISSRVDMVLTPLRPKLTVSTDILEFGEENTTLTLDITNTGKGILQWQITEDIEWLECKPLTGKTEKEVSSVVVTVSREGWPKGDYSRTFVFSSNGGSAVIKVNMSVSGCALQVSPQEIDLGETESSAKLTLTNKGNGSVNYEIKSSNDWICLSKTSGKVSTTDYMTVTVNRGSLAAGEYSGQITFIVGEETVIVPIKLIIPAKSCPMVSFDAVKNVAYNGAVLSGTIISVGNTKITRYGFCWAQHTEPTVNDSFSNMGDCSIPMSFDGTITNLAANTKYHVRAYAENDEGISYSNEEAFTTTGIPVIPTVQTKEITNIKSNTASAGGFLSSLGNVTVISQHGHIWGTSDKLEVSKATKTELGKLEEPTAFSSEITDLNPNQKYYVCAYATNEKGTAYGETIQFTTSAADMVLTTNEVTDIIHNAATCGGTITNYGGRTVKECGVCWSLKEEAVSTNDWKVISKLEKDKWSCRLEGLDKETDYYARAYVQASDGALFYGPIRKFTTTQEVKLPSIAKVTITGIDTQGATLQSSVTDKGNSIITTCGFCWSTNANPTTENETLACETANAAFGAKLSGLKDGAKYYVRAYAINAMGIGYSEQAEFTTTAITVPIWGTASVLNIGRTRVNVSAALTSNGNAEITEMGVCWATHPESSVYDEKFVCQNGNSISTQVTGLQGTTTYYLRVYAQNAKGIAYSNEVSFTTTNSEVDVWDGVSADTKFAGGSGTENDPIVIESAAQLKLLADKVNSGTTYAGVYFKLASNIDLNNKEWTPIGNSKKPFMGILDGNKNSITNLKITNKANAGLLGMVQNAAILNLKVSGNIKCETKSAVSMLCGKAEIGTFIINNVETFGLIIGNENVGGLCGDFGYCELKMQNCINRCQISGNWSGGLLGYGGTSSNNKIMNCANYGDISGNAGLIGYWSSGTIFNCCNHSNVTGGCGLIYKTYNYTTIENSFWLNDISSNVGTEYSTNSSGRWKKTNCGYYTRNSTNCPIITMNSQDLIDALNEWVNNNDPTLYRKWIYKKDSEGKVCPAME